MELDSHKRVVKAAGESGRYFCLGTIKDETGGVLPGVDVVVKNLDTGLTRSVVRTRSPRVH